MPAPRTALRPRQGTTRWAIVLSLGLTLGLAAPATAMVPEQEHPLVPSVLFELKEPRTPGVLEPGTPLQLAIQLTGLTAADEVVAIIEGDPFVRRLVPMQLDEDSRAFRSLVTLEPAGQEEDPGPEKAMRLRATFARIQGMMLDHILTRVVYVTLQLPAEAASVTTAPFTQAPPETEAGISVAEEFTEEALGTRVPVNRESAPAVSEEDIIPNPVSAEAQVYWLQVSRRIGRTWRHPPLQTATPPAPAGVGVRFRLHANGEAQLIQIERSSGVPEVDEAGLQAVLHAHPFPPFPPDVRDDAVDMHIELGQGSEGPPIPSRQNGAAGERVSPSP